MLDHCDVNHFRGLVFLDLVDLHHCLDRLLEHIGIVVELLTRNPDTQGHPHLPFRLCEVRISGLREARILHRSGGSRLLVVITDRGLKLGPVVLFLGLGHSGEGQVAECNGRNSEG